MDKFFVLIFWWTELVILRIHRKFYQSFIFNFGKKICIVSDLKHFLPHWKTCFMPSFGMVEISYCDGFYVMCSLLCKVLGNSSDRIGLLAKRKWVISRLFFSFNIFIIKQSMLLTFLRLRRIVSSDDWKHKKRDYRNYPQIF